MTSALWPTEPTGPVPQRISLGSARALELLEPDQSECESNKNCRRKAACDKRTCRMNTREHGLILPE